MTYHIGDENPNNHTMGYRHSGENSDVRYYTTRPLQAALSAQILPMLLMLPVIIIEPSMGAVVLLTAVAMAIWVRASFKFELTDRELRVRPHPFSPLVALPLRDLEAVEALDPAGKPLTWGRVAPMGHLRLKLRDGEELLIAGLSDPVETADAVRILQRGSAPSVS